MSKAYLITWNPKKWDFKEGFDAFCHRVQAGGEYVMDWAAINSAIQEGDELYLMKLGDNPRGIVAKGIALSSPFTDEHYDDELAFEGKTAKYVSMKVVSVGDYKRNQYISWERLKSIFPKQNWTPQGSGIVIYDEYHSHLNRLWDALFDSITPEFDINTPMKPQKVLLKGDRSVIYVCGRCGSQFKKALRCPDCGQLTKSDAAPQPSKTLCVGDNVSRLKIYEIINKYFGKNYKGWMKAWYEINDDYAAWFPTITATNTRPNGTFGGTVMYSNTLSPDRKAVLEINHDAPNGVLTPAERETWGTKKRLVFARIDGVLVFLGVFKTIHVKEAENKTFRHERIAKGINLSTFELIDPD